MRVQFLVTLFLACLVQGCASSRIASGTMSPWQSVHQFPAETAPVSLSPAVMYRVTPMDMTLRQLLARWAFVAGMQLDYSASVDWQVHQAAAAVEAATLGDALTALTKAYASEQLLIEVRNGVISVRERDAHGTQ